MQILNIPTSIEGTVNRVILFKIYLESRICSMKMSISWVLSIYYFNEIGKTIPGDSLNILIVKEDIHTLMRFFGQTKNFNTFKINSSLWPSCVNHLSQT